MAFACLHWGSVEGEFRKGTVASVHLSVWKKAVPPLLPWCQTLHFVPVCHWCPSSCCPGAGAQKEWVWVSLCMGSLRGSAWDLSSFFHQLNPHWFLRPDVTEIYLTGTPGRETWCWTGTPDSRDSPPEFLPTTRGCGTSPFRIFAPLSSMDGSPASLDGCGFFNSIVVRFPFNLISDGAEWWLFYSLVVILMWLC